MPFVAGDLTPYYGTVVDNGECVRFVQTVTGAPHTSLWRRGVKVRSGGVATLTAIATFGDDGRYTNANDGNAHAAILLAEHSDGLLCADQWVGHPVAQRVIRFRDGAGDDSNDGDAFWTIETDGND